MSRMLRRFISWLPWNTKQAVNRRLNAMGYVLLRYGTEERARVLELTRKIHREVPFLLDDSEASQIFNAVQQTAKVEGDLAEVGVFRGGSAKLICEAKGDRPLHLFDTFEGLPPPGARDATRFAAGQYVALLEEVRQYLSGYPEVFFYKGFFPDTAGPIADRRFSFVHLDVDLYESTLNCLSYFYPRMNPGGVLMSHDYTNAEGVRQAFDQFFADKPEPVLEVALSQALVVKV
jgi:O-methyltransferase